MDATPSYQVIFSGKLREGFEQAQVKQALAERLKLPKPQLEQLFGGKPLVLKRTASAEEAKRLVTALAGLGAITRIQADKDAKKAAQQPATEAVKHSVELPHFSPYPKGGRLTAALALAGISELLFALLYLVTLFALSVGLLYTSLFTTWGTAVTGFGPLALLLQLLVLPLGLLGLFLIAKPLLSLQSGQRHGIVLHQEQEARLHAFVADVCERIGAPLPRAIRINNDIAVELDYQGVPGFLSNRTVLRIGAPLTAASDTSQLAALIAQSLQLFHSKSLSPRAAYLLRRSDGWLQRAIYGKDVVDRALADLLEEKSPYAPIARALQQLIALSRHALGWRLRLSRSLNRRLMHRLVADADKVSLVFTGSDGFRQLIEQQRLLAFASQNILPSLKDRWLKEGTLPDNLVQALVLRCKKYPPTIHAQLRAVQEREKAVSHDTIPADSQRLRRVSKSEIDAAYPDHAPATTLFRNFPKLAKTMTLRLYHNRLGLPVTPDRLVPAAAPSKQLQQQQLQIDAIFNHLYYDFLPLKLRHRIKMVDGYEEAVAQQRSAVQESAASRSHAELAFRRCVENERALIDITTQELMYRSGLWRQWGIEAEGKEGIEQIHNACREQEKGLEENIGLLAHQLQPQMQRLAASLALLATPQAQGGTNTQALHKEVTGLVEVLERIEQAAQQLRELRLHTILLRILLSYDGSARGKLHDRIQEQAGDIRQLLAGLGAGLKTTPYPFGAAHRNLMAFALHNAYPEATPEGDFDRGNDVVEQIIRVQRHILARLCAIALHVEKGLGL